MAESFVALNDSQLGINNHMFMSSGYPKNSIIHEFKNKAVIYWTARN